MVNFIVYIILLLRTLFSPTVSREQSKIEADLENKTLNRRRELLNQGVEPKNIRVRDGSLPFETRIMVQGEHRRIKLREPIRMTIYVHPLPRL